MKSLYLPKLMCICIMFTISMNLPAQNFHLVKDNSTSKDSKPSNYYNFSDGLIRPFTVLNGVSYFAADDGLHGIEFFRSDGTEAGTYLVKDVLPGTASSKPENIIMAGNKIYFIAADSSGDNNTRSVWVSDGTTAGTVLLKSLVNPTFPTVVGGLLYFIAEGKEIWKSDGTTEGTKMLVDFTAPPFKGFYVYSLSNVYEKLFFSAADYDSSYGQYAVRLWVTDGSINGTKLISKNAMEPDQLTAGPNNLIYFSANASLNSYIRTLWVTSGTPGGVTTPVTNNNNVNVSRY